MVLLLPKKSYRPFGWFLTQSSSAAAFDLKICSVERRTAVGQKSSRKALQTFCDIHFLDRSFTRLAAAWDANHGENIKTTTWRCPMSKHHNFFFALQVVDTSLAHVPWSKGLTQKVMAPDAKQHCKYPRAFPGRACKTSRSCC